MDRSRCRPELRLSFVRSMHPYASGSYSLARHVRLGPSVVLYEGPALPCLTERCANGPCAL